ncbi:MULTISPECIES: iron-containing alcohol dehydrogenase [unclassified Pseudovibrio]|uniref:iron-containing alcohol dehydrogenase n=1 Tax=unclassified Pseudovibrio TaxID=2627060 RepID=UPI0007AED7A5|nr:MULTISPECIES: iron-containing alcohol dehydrogenase [unclassified Pseudovibrio]KZL12764.1 1,3-propanediol dehydrogenase [Pseudovibrio sp. Ad26]KZL25921.1 1,3-propanediol dehydrogenase [Pseudovibrio sp. WM33]
MTGFVFNTAASVVCEPGAVQKLDELTLKTIGKRVFLVSDKGLMKAGLVEPVIAQLEAAGIDVTLFDDVVADPPEAIVLQAADLATSAGVDGVIGLGGGSSQDVAKLVALLVGGGEQLTDIYGVGMAKGKRLPLILIPTTAGTGSEVTPISIITTGEAEKKGVVSPSLLPDVAILDADLTVGLPPHVTAATGIDAMVHAIEAYTSTSANNNPVSKVLAQEALRLLGANIEKAVNTPQDKEARSNMLLGSMLAGQAFANSPVAAVHALAYPIGGIFHVPHGVSNALVLPHVMRFNLPTCAQAYAELAPLVFPELSEIPADNRGSVFADRLAELSKVLGVETTLREVGINEQDVVKLASEAMKQTRLLVNNPREVDEDSALKIYQQAL